MPPSNTTLPTFPTRIDLAGPDRDTLIQLLNQRLADTADLYSQVKQAHWNVKGLNFFQLHELFDKLAGELLPFVDMIAERATALGGTAAGTVRMAAAFSSLTEYSLALSDGPQHLKALIDRYAAYTANVRAAIDAAEQNHDKGTADLFTEISREADKHLWFLEAHLQK